MTHPAKRRSPDDILESTGLAAGQILPGTRYKIIGALAEGGMGAVLEAEHIGLKKPVVVKLIHDKIAGQRELDRMRVEAQTLAALNHPNIVQVSDFGQTENGKTFLVMERLYGKTLGDEIVDRRFLPVAEAIEITLQILAGLGAAHEAGILHRDIKAANVFLCNAAADDGQRIVKLLDFGAAKILRSSEDAAGRAPAPLAFPTEEGFTIGTPRFFSPEQASAKPLDARSDLYAVGLLLYSTIVGHGPFVHIAGETAIKMAHIELIPSPPSTYATQPITPELDRALMKCLEKNPDDRFQTARAFAAELSAIASGRSSRVARSEDRAFDSFKPSLSTSLITEPLPALGKPDHENQPRDNALDRPRDNALDLPRDNALDRPRDNALDRPLAPRDARPRALIVAIAVSALALVVVAIALVLRLTR